MEKAVRDLFRRLAAKAETAPELPDWQPETKGRCLCSHSWIFHSLMEPHDCNECRAQGRACRGYSPLGLSDYDYMFSDRCEHVLVHGSKKWVKHVFCDGARFHVMSWSSGPNGARRHCSEKDCVVNRPTKEGR
jgi:hypothetical protein